LPFITDKLYQNPVYFLCPGCLVLPENLHEIVPDAPNEISLDKKL
jgi:hypothetical protein